MSEEKMTLQAAVAYLQPIADSAVVGGYAEALGTVMRAAQAVSLPDRETLANIIERGSAAAFINGARGSKALAHGSADAVLAALSTQPAAEQVRAVQGWMALDLHMALGKEPDMRSEVENQGHSSWADWWAELCGEVRALSAQTVEGEVESKITDEQVEAAARVLLAEYRMQYDGGELSEFIDLARAALEATRGVQS